MENHEFEQVVGNRDAPFINSLAGDNALARSFFATSHPSLPNYLALLGGDTFGITSDCTSCHVASQNLVDQLEAAHISWKAYMEGMPHPCFKESSTGRYAKKHNPFAYFDDVIDDPVRCERIVPSYQLAADTAAKALPRFIWVTPDLCDDMHDCSVATGDRFLASLVRSLLPSLGRSGILFLTFDEGGTGRGCCSLAHGGHVVTIVAGGGARPGSYTGDLDHYSILRAIEDAWSLPRLGRAACPCTPSMSALFGR